MADQLVKTGAHGEQLYVSYSISQDIANNQSTVSCHMWIRIPAGWNIGPWGDYGGSYVGRSSLTFNGGIGNISAGDHTLSDTKTFTVSHNADGTGSTAIEWKWGVNSSWGGFVKPSGSFSVGLPTIPRATQPTLSVSTVVMGDKLTITTAGASDAFTHRLTYSWYNSGWQEIASGVKSGYEWSVPLAFANSIPDSSSGWGTVLCETYKDATLIGSKSIQFTATVPDSLKPTCDCTIADATDCYATYGAFVQSKSKLMVSVTATQAYSSPIKSYNILFEGKQYQTQNATTDPISGAGTLTVKISVVDSRGRSSEEAVKTVSVLEYKSPVVTLTAARCTSAGAQSPEGAYMKITVSAVIAELNGQNSATYQIRYKAAGAEQWVELNGSGQSYTSDALECQVDQPWSIEATITDKLGSTPAAATIPVAFTLIDFYRDGTGVSIGGIATGPGLKCYMDVDFRGELKYQGKTLIDYLLPIGKCIIEFSAEFDPNTAYPGTTWERVKDVFLLAAGDVYDAGSTGGAAEVTLTVDEMPSHEHIERKQMSNGSLGNIVQEYDGSTPDVTDGDYLGIGQIAWYNNKPPVTTTGVGGSKPHNNMPPYIAVYMWKRVA